VGRALRRDQPEGVVGPGISFGGNRACALWAAASARVYLRCWLDSGHPGRARKPAASIEHQAIHQPKRRSQALFIRQIGRYIRCLRIMFKRIIRKCRIEAPGLG
jgi:hypothetical protein